MPIGRTLFVSPTSVRKKGFKMQWTVLEWLLSIGCAAIQELTEAPKRPWTDAVAALFAIFVPAKKESKKVKAAGPVRSPLFTPHEFVCDLFSFEITAQDFGLLLLPLGVHYLGRAITGHHRPFTWRPQCVGARHGYCPVCVRLRRPTILLLTTVAADKPSLPFSAHIQRVEPPRTTILPRPTGPPFFRSEAKCG